MKKQKAQFKYRKLFDKKSFLTALGISTIIAIIPFLFLPVCMENFPKETWCTDTKVQIIFVCAGILFSGIYYIVKSKAISDKLLLKGVEQGHRDARKKRGRYV